MKMGLLNILERCPMTESKMVCECGADLTQTYSVINEGKGHFDGYYITDYIGEYTCAACGEEVPE